MKKQVGYDSQSISSLKGADRVRKRPAVIFGSDGLEGCEHAFFEILSNAIDEAKEGYGKQINITVNNDKSIEIEDFGRGVPMGWNEKEGRYNWELVYCELYAGGKYNNSEGSAYEFSLGLNGLGACATQYASEWFEVSSYKGGEKSSVSFRKGVPITELRKEPCAKNRTGTTISWKNDLEVFTDIDIQPEYFHDIVKKQAIVNNGLNLTLKIQQPDGKYEKTDYCYTRGIVEYIEEYADGDMLVPVTEYSCERMGRDRADKDMYKLRIQFAFTFSNKKKLIEYYHNSSYLEHGGSPDKATRSAFVRACDKYARDNNKYNKKESKLTYADVEESLILVVNSLSNQVSYANQTKKAINNVFIAEAMTEFFMHSLEVYFAENPQNADKIITQLLINKRSRESAEHMRASTKTKLTTSLDINNTVDKFVGCRIKDPEKCELYIVEGDSALGSVKLARNAEFQAIIPVRGKTLNCLKAGYDKILKNDIIMDLIKVIGCGMEMKDAKGRSSQMFNLAGLRWSKIIICTDADEDGYQIRTLILSMIYRLLPTLIREGRIYVAETPLYEITTKKDTFFAFDEREKQRIIEEIGDQKYTLQRSKGLGENDPEMMSVTTMHPATRHLIRIKPEDEQSTFEMFDILLGDNLPGRKEFIAENGSKYLALADI